MTNDETDAYLHGVRKYGEAHPEFRQQQRVHVYELLASLEPLQTLASAALKRGWEPWEVLSLIAKSFEFYTKAQLGVTVAALFVQQGLATALEDAIADDDDAS